VNIKHFTPILLVLSLALAGCDRISPPAPTSTATTIPEDASKLPGRTGPEVVASGEVVPVRTVGLSFESGGSVLSVEVAEDDRVESGQLLAQLDGGDNLGAAVIAAELEVLSARQALDALTENLGVAQAAAFQEIVDANQVIGDTQYRLFNLTVPQDYAGMETKAALEIAKEKLEAARQSFEPYRFRSSGDSARRDRLDAVERAQSDFNALLRIIELEAALKTAQANLARAESKYETLSQGPDPDEVALAEARLANAEAQLAVARDALESLALYAPVDGTAVSVDILPGATVLPGTTVIALADLSELRVETTDLSERDVAEVAVGQPATVYIEALDLDVTGRVARIAPQANVVGGDVVYTVQIELDEQPDGLRWGMTVEVTIETE
jgi:multidrug efflux pump subunit AcrA (membrane-fusion protein)